MSLTLQGHSISHLGEEELQVRCWTTVTMKDTGEWKIMNQEEFTGEVLLERSLLNTWDSIVSNLANCGVGISADGHFSCSRQGLACKYMGKKFVRIWSSKWYSYEFSRFPIA